jgi:hypothetical protein
MYPLLVPLIAALLGAAATGIVKIFLDARQRQHDRKSALLAIVSEVDSICRLIRHQRYLEAVEQVIEQIQAGGTQPVLADIGPDYFSVFEALAGRLGEQRPEHVRDIVRFFAYAKAARDSVLPDGVFADGNKNDQAEVLSAMINLSALLGAMLLLGEKITTFPDAQFRHFDPWPGEEPKSLTEARASLAHATEAQRSR